MKLWQTTPAEDWGQNIQHIEWEHATFFILSISEYQKEHIQHAYMLFLQHYSDFSSQEDP